MSRELWPIIGYQETWDGMTIEMELAVGDDLFACYAINIYLLQ